MEKSGHGWSHFGGVDWGRVSDGDMMDEREMKLSDLEMDMTKYSQRIAARGVATPSEAGRPRRATGQPGWG